MKNHIDISGNHRRTQQKSHRKSIEIQEKYNGIPTGKPKEISQEYQRNAIEIPQKPISFNAVAPGSSAAVAAVAAAEQ